MGCWFARVHYVAFGKPAKMKTIRKTLSSKEAWSVLLTLNILVCLVLIVLYGQSITATFYCKTSFFCQYIKSMFTVLNFIKKPKSAFFISKYINLRMIKIPFQKPEMKGRAIALPFIAYSLDLSNCTARTICRS